MKKVDKKMAKGTGAIVLLAIIAVAGLGLSGYMFVKDQFFGGNEPEGLKLVALWDDLNENLTNNPLYNTNENFLIAYEDQIVLDTQYVNVVNNTRFNLLVPGLYKINLNVILNGVNDAGAIYWVWLIVNGTDLGYFLRLENGSPADSMFYYSVSNLYINASSSEDYYEIRALGYDPFYVATDSSTPYFNQLYIEYVLG